MSPRSLRRRKGVMLVGLGLWRGRRPEIQDPERGEKGVCKRVSPSSKATHGGGWRSFGAGGGAGTGPAASGPGRRPRRRALTRPPRLTPRAGGSQRVSDPGLWGPDTRLFLGDGGECGLRT